MKKSVKMLDYLLNINTKSLFFLLVLALRLLQMVLMLLLVQVTFTYLSSTEFIIFNILQFYVSLGMVIGYPTTVSLWNPNIDRHEVQYRLTRITLFLFAIYSVLGIRLIFLGDFTTTEAWFLFFGFVFYGQFKINERYIATFYLTRKKYLFSYLFSIMVLSFEIILVVFFMLAIEKDIISRIFFPTVFLTLLVQYCLFKVLGYIPKLVIEDLFKRDFWLSAFGKEKNLIAYSLLVITASMLDRELITFVSEDFVVKAEYLLVLSYATAGYSLATALIDYYRPMILDRATQGTTQLRAFNLKVITLIAINFILFALGGFSILWLFLDKNLLILICWLLICSFYFVFSIINLINIPLVFKGHRSIILSWLLGLTVKLVFVAYTIFTGDFYITRLIGSSILMVIVTLGSLGAFALTQSKIFILPNLQNEK